MSYCRFSSDDKLSSVYVYDVVVKHALAKVQLLAPCRLLKRRRPVAHPPHWLDADGQGGAGALGEGSLDASDDGAGVGAADQSFIVLRDGPRMFILGTHK